mmetsp:Transcript_144847/g.204999  ORF Transcript_144847/g.204999 Transcript_144847/m.204999 type:complete len:282 (-) Transcript_144847:376-1221(-)
MNNRLHVFCFYLPHQLLLLLTIVWVLAPIAEDVHEDDNHLPFESIPKNHVVLVVSIGGIPCNVNGDVVKLRNHAHQTGSVVEQVNNRRLHALQAAVPAPGHLGKAAGAAFLCRSAFQDMHHRGNAKCKLAVVQTWQAPLPARQGHHPAGSRVRGALADPRIIDATRAEPGNVAPETREASIEVLHAADLLLQDVERLVSAVEQRKCRGDLGGHILDGLEGQGKEAQVQSLFGWCRECSKSSVLDITGVVVQANPIVGHASVWIEGHRCPSKEAALHIHNVG